MRAEEGGRRDKQDGHRRGAAKEERAKEERGGGKQGEGQGGEGTVAGSGDLVAQRSAEVAVSYTSMTSLAWAGSQLGREQLMHLEREQLDSWGFVSWDI